MTRCSSWLIEFGAILAWASCAVAQVPSSQDAVSPETAKETGFVKLFDGRTLAGWQGDAESFRVEDGAIVAGTLKERIPRNEFLCTTKEYTTRSAVILLGRAAGR